MRRQALARWGSGLPPAACQILRRVASALTEKAVGGSIPPDAGTYQTQQGKACHRRSNGLSGESIPLSGKVLFCSVEAHLPSGYSRHHERAELRRQAPRWGSSTRQRATSCRSYGGEPQRKKKKYTATFTSNRITIMFPKLKI